eukprot:15458022-Alexandrium_andersonii.AAC.1
MPTGVLGRLRDRSRPGRCGLAAARPTGVEERSRSGCDEAKAATGVVPKSPRITAAAGRTPFHEEAAAAAGSPER